MGEVVIRRGRVEDLRAAAEMLEELSRLQAPWRVFAPRPHSRDEILARYEAATEDREALPLVAEVDGAVVGMALGSLHRPSSISDEPAVEVSGFVVRETHRGRGIGSALASRVFEFARDRGVRRLDLRVFAENDRAVAFWTRHGFRPRIIQMVADAISPDRPPPS